MEMSFNSLLINSTVRKYKLSCSLPPDNASQSIRHYLPENLYIKVPLQATSILLSSQLVHGTPGLFS